MRMRLREKYSQEDLEKIYAEPHVHTRWFDHLVRVETTTAVVRHINAIDEIKTAADLSAGDATIINSLNLVDRYIGDFAPKYQFTGPIEKTIDEIPNVDLFICSETIEHLDNPDEVLKRIRQKTKWIVVTTPIGEFNTGNLEHYWGWDTEDVEQMLVNAGFRPFILNKLAFYEPQYTYDYQIWICR